MLLKFFTSFTILTAICVPYISATIVSLLVPGDLVDDGLPITANPIGTDSTGHTTWVLAVGAPSGTFTASETGATPQAGAPFLSVLIHNAQSDMASTDTLVAGATDMHIIETSADGTAVQTGREDCVFATPTASGGAPIASCVIQVQNGQSTATLAFTEPVSFLPVQVADKTSGSSSPAPTQTGKGGNGAGRMGFMGVGELAVLGLMNVLLSVVL